MVVEFCIAVFMLVVSIIGGTRLRSERRYL